MDLRSQHSSVRLSWVARKPFFQYQFGCLFPYLWRQIGITNLQYNTLQNKWIVYALVYGLK